MATSDKIINSILRPKSGYFGFPKYGKNLYVVWAIALAKEVLLEGSRNSI